MMECTITVGKSTETIVVPGTLLSITVANHHNDRRQDSTLADVSDAFCRVYRAEHLRIAALLVNEQDIDPIGDK